MATCAAFPALAQLDSTVSGQEEVDRAAAASQANIDEIVELTQDAAQRYARALAEADSLQQYNDQLERQVRSQETEMASLEQQMLEIDTTNRELQPLMERMVDSLDQFVSVDVPFLLDERRGRVASLQDLLARADVSVSEKYRRILEAYQIELEYGRTLEAYEGVLEVEGQEPRTVEFVQLGRVALMYQTLDGAETGYWDNQQKTWVVDNSYADEVEKALQVARQEVAPDLLILPVPAPEEVGS
jgi:chromosome segregation ATPase